MNRIRSNGSATATEASQANSVLLEYLASLVDKRVQNAQDDLIGTLVKEQVSSLSRPSWCPFAAANTISGKPRPHHEGRCRPDRIPPPGSRQCDHGEHDQSRRCYPAPALRAIARPEGRSQPCTTICRGAMSLSSRLSHGNSACGDL